MSDFAKQYLEARDNGYSDEDIARHFAGDKYDEAIKEGYSPKDVIHHFTGEMINQVMGESGLTGRDARYRIINDAMGAGIQGGVQAALAPFNPQSAASPIQPTSTNPFMAAIQAAGQTLKEPARISPTLSQPGQMMGQQAEQAIGPDHPILGKAANIGVSAALDPQSFVTGPAAEGLGKVGEAAAKVVGEKVLAPTGAVLTGTRIKDIINLFKNPIEVMTAPTLKKSGAAMGDVEKALGVTEDEMRLIAKAGDRATGGSRTVVEGLIQEGKSRAAAAGAKPEEWATHLTPGELIAGRRASSKLTQTAKGRETFIAAKDVRAFEDAFVDKAKDKAIAYLQALKDQSNARTREAFTQLFPRNVTTSPNALRGLAMIGTAAKFSPWAALAGSPAVTGLATVAAKAGYKTGAAIGGVASQVGIPTGISAIRQYLQKGI